MAATEVQGSHIGFYMRDAGSTDPYLRVVCEETLTFNITNDINTTKTKCGVFKGIDVADFKANGQAVCNITPTASEMSYDEMVTIQLARTKQEFVLQNEAYTADGTSYALGEVIKLAGECYINDTQLTAPVDDVLKFTWSVEGSGTLSDTES